MTHLYSGLPEICQISGLCNGWLYCILYIFILSKQKVIFNNKNLLLYIYIGFIFVLFYHVNVE